MLSVRNLLIVSIISLITGIIFYSCDDKINEVNYNPNVLSAKDYIRAEDALFEIVNVFLKGVHDTAVIKHGYRYIDSCTVRFFPSEDLIIFGYGAVDRFCTDSKFRRGRVIAEFDGDVFLEGVTASLVTDSLFVDDIPYEVNLTITNLGINADNYPEFSLQLISSYYILQDTNETHGISLAADFNMIWTEGISSPEHEDDTYMINGEASGTSSDLYEFSVNIEEPLRNHLDCFWIISGISQITVPSGGIETGTIDYITVDNCNNEMNFYFNDNFFYEVIK